MDLKDLVGLLHDWLLVLFFLAVSIALIIFNMSMVYRTRKTGHFHSGVPGFPPLIGTLPATGAIMHFLQLPPWTVMAILPLAFITILLIQSGLLYLTELVCTLLRVSGVRPPNE